MQIKPSKTQVKWDVSASPQKGTVKDSGSETQQLQVCHETGSNVPDQSSTDAHTNILSPAQQLVQHYQEYHKKQDYPVSPTSSTGSPNSRARPTKTASLLIPWVQTTWLKSLSITDIHVEDLAAQHKAIHQLQSHLGIYQWGPSRKLTQQFFDTFPWEERLRIYFFLEVFFNDILNNIHLLLFPDSACQKHKSYKTEEERKQSLPG